MMGTLHARNFDLSRNDREIRISIENLGKSVEEAEKVSEDEVIHRLCIIKKAAYSPNGEACSDKKTDALTSLVAQPIFENWWSQRKHTVEGTQKCSK